MVDDRPEVPPGLPPAAAALAAQPGERLGEETQAARMGELIMRIFLHIRQRLRVLYAEDNAEHNLSVTETLVLWTISTSGPMKFHSLSRQVGIPVSTLTTMVDRMESRGFLRRRPDRDDRRAIFVEGTPDLDRIKERHTALIRAEMQSVVARMGHDQAVETLRGLEHMALALTGGSEPADAPEVGTQERAGQAAAGREPEQAFRTALDRRPSTSAGRDER